MITAEQALESFTRLGITHLVWIPDSVMGRWEAALDRSNLPLIRVCREGEAWPLAAGLYAGGARPLILMQTTGLFESGDALRNVVFDLRVPVYAWIGVRNWLNVDSNDSARRFAMPMIDAWQLDHIWMRSADDLPAVWEHYQRCQADGRAGVALLAEGAG
jgi:sulfopyruvate decarboxylase subunit alpha